MHPNSHRRIQNPWVTQTKLPSLIISIPTGHHVDNATTGGSDYTDTSRMYYVLQPSDEQPSSRLARRQAGGSFDKKPQSLPCILLAKVRTLSAISKKKVPYQHLRSKIIIITLSLFIWYVTDKKIIHDPQIIHASHPQMVQYTRQERQFNVCSTLRHKPFLFSRLAPPHMHACTVVRVVMYAPTSTYLHTLLLTRVRNGSYTI
jgi:hypothetical protein